MVNLLPEETMRMMAHSLLTVEDKISFVGEIMEKSNDARESRNLWSLIEELANGIYNAMWEDFCNHASQYNAIP